jgi:hypothetical protein
LFDGSFNKGYNAPRVSAGDLLPVGIFHAMKISVFSAAAEIACQSNATKVRLKNEGKSPFIFSGATPFYLSNSDILSVLRGIPSKIEISRLNPLWSLHHLLKPFNQNRFSG